MAEDSVLRLNVRWPIYTECCRYMTSSRFSIHMKTSIWRRFPKPHKSFSTDLIYQLVQHLIVLQKLFHPVHCKHQWYFFVVVAVVKTLGIMNFFIQFVTRRSTSIVRSSRCQVDEEENRYFLLQLVLWCLSTSWLASVNYIRSDMLMTVLQMRVTKRPLIRFPKWQVHANSSKHFRF